MLNDEQKVEQIIGISEHLIAVYRLMGFSKEEALERFDAEVTSKLENNYGREVTAMIFDMTWELT